MATQRHERAYEQYAWIIFLAEGLIAFLPSDNPFPVGNGYFVFAVVTVGISLTGFRTGAKWAWFAFLYTPIFFAVVGYAQLGSPFFPGAIVLGLVPCVAGLLLPYRKFFPRKEVRTGSLDAST